MFFSFFTVNYLANSTGAKISRSGTGQERLPIWCNTNILSPSTLLSARCCICCAHHFPLFRHNT